MALSLLNLSKVMSSRRATIAAVVFVVVATIVWISSLPKEVRRAHRPAKRGEDGVTNPTARSGMRQQPGGPYVPADPRWNLRSAMRASDPQFEWKTPLNFYGKVVDDQGAPAADVTITLTWTDLSLQGSSSTRVASDANGRFSVQGKRGKNLVVSSVEKPGYQDARRSNRHIFEFSAFFDRNYYEADRDTPVLFVVRKMRSPAPLVFSEGKIIAEAGVESEIPIPVQAVPGTLSVSPVIGILITTNDQSVARWRATISLKDGGLIPAFEEFPNEAPDGGYEEVIDWGEASRQPPGWPDIDEGGRFYIKVADRFGLLTFRQMKGKKTMYYRVAVNPTGSRDLEGAVGASVGRLRLSR